MNMPLLYWASQVSGDKRFSDAAYRHCQQLCDHFVRADNTTYHTFYFDADSGAPRFGKTAQGASDQSCWARGQAWAIYGFALAHTYTKDTSLLQTATRLCDYFITHLPADKVAYWDLSYSDGSGQERDSSAAAIAVCGMQEIIKWMPAGTERQGYAAAAGEILASLAANYTSRNIPGANDILRHGVYSKPGGAGVDEGNLWGDYFYMEALTRAMRPTGCSTGRGGYGAVQTAVGGAQANTMSTGRPKRETLVVSLISYPAATSDRAGQMRRQSRSAGKRPCPHS